MQTLEMRAQPAGCESTPALPTPAAPVIFHARGLTKTYRTCEVEVRALHDVDLDIARGEFIVLLGPSGSGKSTLLNILGGLDVASIGDVVFDGTDLRAASDAELTAYRRRHVGFVFQFYNLIPSLTVRENVALVTDIVDGAMPVDEAIDRVGLTTAPRPLSGAAVGWRAAAHRHRAGHRQAPCRAALRRADGCPRLPTGKLVLDVIARIHDEIGTTVIVITHNAAIAGMADRIVYLGDGTVQRVETNAHKLEPSELSW